MNISLSVFVVYSSNDPLFFYTPVSGVPRDIRAGRSGGALAALLRGGMRAASGRRGGRGLPRKVWCTVVELPVGCLRRGKFCG